MARVSERLYVARSGTSATNTTAVALAAATTKTVVGTLGSSSDTISLVRARISFDGVAAAGVPALVEIGITSSAGTSTAFTPVQHNGPSLVSSCACGYNYTVEPTYNRILDSFYLPVTMGHFTDWAPLGEEVQCDPSQGLAIRVTAPAAVNCLASILYAE